MNTTEAFQIELEDIGIVQWPGKPKYIEYEEFFHAFRDDTVRVFRYTNPRAPLFYYRRNQAMRRWEHGQA